MDLYSCQSRVCTKNVCFAFLWNFWESYFLFFAKIYFRFQDNSLKNVLKIFRKRNLASFCKILLIFAKICWFLLNFSFQSKFKKAFLSKPYANLNTFNNFHDFTEKDGGILMRSELLFLKVGGRLCSGLHFLGTYLRSRGVWGLSIWVRGNRHPLYFRERWALGWNDFEIWCTQTLWWINWGPYCS